MKINLNEVLSSPLFMGMSETDANAVISCLEAHLSRFSKNDYIYHLGDNHLPLGLVLAGSVIVIKEDFWGNRSILAHIGAGELFGEVYACMPEEPMGVSVVAAEVCDILFLHADQILFPCGNGCAYHTKLMQNFVAVLARKNLMLTEKLEHITKRSIRDKVLSYLSLQSVKTGKKEFEIPFNRQELADYLSVDRSALSSELGKLKEEGILDFQKNRFNLLKRTNENGL